MAIYSFSTKPISRGAGRSAVAAAAYRSGSALVDERTGLVADYTRKSGVEHTEIVTRDGVPTPEREALWNDAESAERRKDSRVAREYVIALPAELDADQRLALAREISRELVERYGVAVDLAIHAPDRDGDQRNHHAHLLTTTRTYSHDGLGDKSAIEWSDKKRRDAGLDRGADEVKMLRQRWETLANAALERADQDARIDCRSLADQGIDRVPQIHVGPMGTEMQRRGTPELSDRATLNLEIQATNAQLHQLQERAARRAAERQAEYEDIRATVEAIDAERAAVAAERAELDAMMAELPEPKPEPQKLTRAPQRQERQERPLEPPKAPPGPSPAVQRIDAQIDATRRELPQARERLADIEERMLDVHTELTTAAKERDSTKAAAQEAAGMLSGAQQRLDSVSGWFAGGRRREAQQRVDNAQERHQSAERAARAAAGRYSSLARQYGELREQAAPAKREVEQLEARYKELHKERAAHIEREQRPEPAQERQQRQGDAWSREAAAQRDQGQQRDAWADARRERRQSNDRGQDGPELG